MMGLGSPALDAAYDRWKTTPPDEYESSFTCDKCEEIFYPGEYVYNIEGSCLCKRCALEWLELQSEEVSEEDCYSD